MIFNRGGGCSGAQQGANQCFEVKKAIGINCQEVKYRFFDITIKDLGCIGSQKREN